MAEVSPEPGEGDAATMPMAKLPPSPGEVLETVDRPSTIRLFNTHAFFRLWLAQVVSSLGDWIGFLAITSITARVGSSPEAAVSLVLSVRLLPGFFMAPLAGVLVDRWDRKHVMVGCNLGRAVVLVFVPFVDSVAGLVAASFLLEIMQLLWSPAKEASVPNLVQSEYLPTANSLSLVAAYGTFPLGGIVFTLLAKVAQWMGHFSALSTLEVNQENLALYVDAAAYLLSAALIGTLALRRRDHGRRGRIDVGQTFSELRDGWRYVRSSPVVRAVILGLGTGLFGGGMVVPLGPIFSRETLGAGSAGFGALTTALGFGVAAGIIALSVVQRRLPHERVFVAAVFGGGVSLLLAAASWTLTAAVVWVAMLGLCAGAVYVLGFTILQTNVEDEMRGRIFATLYTLIRLCLLLAFALAPILAKLLGELADSVFDGELSVLGLHVGLPGTRLTLWLGGVIILGSGLLSALSVRGQPPADVDQSAR